MLIGDPRDGLFYPTLTLMVDSYNHSTVADPGPLMMGVLDRWTPTVNIELCPIEARYSISLYSFSHYKSIHMAVSPKCPHATFYLP